MLRLGRCRSPEPFAYIFTSIAVTYMTPTPHRGKRNEPAYVGRVADAVAEKSGRPRAEVVETITRAARSLFGFGDPMLRSPGPAPPG